MSDPFAEQPVPRAALIAIAALLSFTLLATFTARVTHVGTTELPQATAIETLDLLFEDRADGSVVVLDSERDQVIAVLEPGSDGFIRGVLRGLGRERKLREISPAEPYRLTRWDGGRLSLSDLATGVRIDLEPFGPTNIGAFARLFESGTSERPNNPQLSLH